MHIFVAPGSFTHVNIYLLINLNNALLFFPVIRNYWEKRIYEQIVKVKLNHYHTFYLRTAKISYYVDQTICTYAASSRSYLTAN